MTVYIIIILLVCVLDQLTKLYSMNIIAAANGLESINQLCEGMKLTVIDGVFDLTYLENPGMSFGLLQGHRWIFMTVTVIALLLMLAYMITLGDKKKHKLILTSLAMIVGGGLGNMFDRIFLGYVVDFADVKAFGSLWKWIFNFADACVCVGTALLAIALIIDFKKEAKNAK